MAAVMWARPDGSRLLLAPTPAVARFITTVYGFDDVEVVPVHVERHARAVHLQAGGLDVHLEAGPGWRLPLPRLRRPGVTRWVEAPIARALLGVHTFGVSPTGVREWYQADEWRPVRAASGRLDGHDLGPLRNLDPPVGFGFSEPPRRASLVLVRPLLVDPSGRLDAIVAEADGGVAPPLAAARTHPC